jgi:3-(3-hydroxy-phenyl)propionate hydroxylase
MREREVVVVGAGPVGLTAALSLRSMGLAATVMEAGAATRARPGSRAIFLHHATLEILERIRGGLSQELVRHGLEFLTRSTYYRGREVFRKTYQAGVFGALPASISLPQSVTERILLTACIAAGVEFIWNAPVARVLPSAAGVQILSETAEPLQARYVIGADGSRSSVRKSCGLALEGPRTTNAYVIVDVQEEPHQPLPVERTFHYEHPAVDGRNVLFVPFAGHWRVDLQCHKTDNPDDFSGPEGVRTWLPLVMPTRYADRVTWVSTYVFRQAVSHRFADAERRVLLAGEAAHIFAPFGARGLNSGVADAFVAARAIHDAISAATPQDAAASIDRFEASRRAAAMRNRAASSTALRHLTARSTLTRKIRRLAATLAPQDPMVARWLDKAPYGPQLGTPDTEGMLY